MRVAYVSADAGVPVFGCKGCSIHVQEVLRALLRRGARIDLFAARLGGEAPAGLADVRVHALEVDRSGDAQARERSAAAVDDAVALALRAHGGFDVVYERQSLWSGAAMEYARDTGVPGILEINAPLIEEQATHRTLLDRERAERVAERAIRAASLPFAVSAGVAARVSVFDEVDGRIRVIPNGVDPVRFAAAALRERTARPFTVGFVGSLKPWHDLTTLAAGFAKLAEQDAKCRLLVVGDGPGAEPLRRELEARGVSGAAHLTGAVAPEKIPALLGEMDVGCAPYAADEDFYFSPLKVLEYMAAGLPTVGARIGQVAQWIEDGKTGLLHPPEDARAMADALDRLRRAPALCRDLGRAARQCAEEEHSWDAVVAGILDEAGAGVR